MADETQNANEDYLKYSSRLLIEMLDASGEWTRAKDWLQHNGTYYETLLATPYFSKYDNAINAIFTGLQIELAWTNDVRDAKMQACLVDTQDLVADLQAQVAALTNQVANLTAEKAALQQQVTALTNEVAGLRMTIEQEVVFLQEKATTLRSIAASYPRVATELNAVIASINQRIEELGGEPVSTEGGSGTDDMVDVE